MNNKPLLSNRYLLFFNRLAWYQLFPSLLLFLILASSVPSMTQSAIMYQVSYIIIELVFMIAFLIGFGLILFSSYVFMRAKRKEDIRILKKGIYINIIAWWVLLVDTSGLFFTLYFIR